MKNIFTKQDHKVWQALIKQQLKAVEKVACPEYLEGLDMLNFSIHQIPTVEEISKKLYGITGWSLIPVDILIPNRIFFNMLANKQFPVINVIRSRKEINFYTNEAPDIFHEFFGHCPLIANKEYAESMHKLAKYAIKLNEELIQIVAKFFWVTFEFGIINNVKKIQIFGAGILPSKNEICRVLENSNTKKIPLNLFTKIETSLQGNISQPVYYTISNLEELYSIIDNGLETLIHKNI